MAKRKKQKLTGFAKLQRRVKLALVPHHHNQYRPHLVRSAGILFIILAVIGLQAGYNVSTGGSVLGAKASVTPDALLADTNAQRQAHSLPPLQNNLKLAQAAYLKAQDMYANQYWAHVSPSGTTPWQWFAKVNYNYAYAGENLAKNFTTADAATTAWMASTEHRANILDGHYSDVGFAVVDGTLDGKPTSLIVALYGKPSAQVTTAAVTTTTSTHTISPLTRLDVLLESLTPAAIIAAALLVLAAIVALVAHFYRHKLPKVYRQAWQRHHHGIIKAAGMTMLLVVVLSLYSGGQI